MAELETPLAFPLGDVTDDEDNRIVKLLKAWTSTLQPIEDTAQAMILQKNVDDAEGAQLDALGKLVGQGRAGLDDVSYRLYIKARIAVNRSNGTFNELIKITVLVLGNPAFTITATNQGPATLTVVIEGATLSMDVAMILSGLLQRAKSGGVRLRLEFNSAAVADWFYLDNFHGATLDHSILFDALPN